MHVKDVIDMMGVVEVILTITKQLVYLYIQR